MLSLFEITLRSSQHSVPVSRADANTLIILMTQTTDKQKYGSSSRSIETHTLDTTNLEGKGVKNSWVIFGIIIIFLEIKMADPKDNRCLISVKIRRRPRQWTQSVDNQRKPEPPAVVVAAGSCRLTLGTRVDSESASDDQPAPRSASGCPLTISSFLARRWKIARSTEARYTTWQKQRHNNN